MRRLVWLLVSAGVLASCGAESERTTKIVFAVDFPEVYGEISVRLSDGTKVLLSEGVNHYSCESPAFELQDEVVGFSALSSRNFEWSGQIRSNGEADCLVIDLDYGSMNSSLFFIAEGRKNCVPMEFSVDGEPWGTVEQAWDASKDLGPTATDKEILAAVLEAATKNRVFFQASREGDAPFEFEWVSANGDCWAEGSGPGWLGPGRVEGFSSAH